MIKYTERQLELFVLQELKTQAIPMIQLLRIGVTTITFST